MNARDVSTGAFIGPMLPAIEVLKPPMPGSLMRAYLRTWDAEHAPLTELVGLDVQSLEKLATCMLKSQSTINRIFDWIRLHGREPRQWTAPITMRSIGEQIIAQAEITGQALSSADLQKVSNHDLMVMVFGRDERRERPIVAGFEGDPRKDANWKSYAWWLDGTLEMPDANLYLTLATYNPMRGTDQDDWHYARRDKHCASVHGFLCDDVRDWQGLALLPTWVIETSPGNYQAVYLLDHPLSNEELRIAEVVQEALVDKGLSDPGAKSPTTRFMRLPVAVNGKHHPPFRCRLVHLNPAARYSVGELRDGLNLTFKPVKPFQPPKPPAQLVGDMAEVQALARQAKIVEMDRDHWVTAMHALRGATLHSPEVGRAIAIEVSWHSSPDEVAATNRFWDTIDTSNLRSGIDTLRRLAGGRADAAKVFTDLDSSAASPSAALAKAVTEPAWREPALVDIGSDAVRNAPPPKFIIPDWLPVGLLTLFAGHGGASKSMLALMIAMLLATGREVLGRAAGAKVPVIFYSAEDRADFIRYRMRRIAAHLGIDPQEWTGTLRVFDATVTDASLWHAAGGSTSSRDGHALGFLADQVQEMQAQLVVIDNASDTFDGNEIVRREVTQFVRALSRRMSGTECAVLLLAHVNRKGAQGEDAAYSGSTAWHNAARARWSIAQNKSLPAGNLVLDLHKSTHGRANRTAAVRIEWAAGVFEVGAPRSSDDLQALLREQVLPALAALIDEKAAAGDYVSWAAQSAARYAPTLLSGRVPGNPTEGELKKAIESLIADGLLVENWARDASARKERKRLELTDKARMILDGPQN